MMKRILAILCSVILVVTCCVMVGCDDKETYEMSLMVHCASNTETSYYIENNVYAVFTPDIDTVVLDLYRIEKRYYTLEYACIGGLDYTKDHTDLGFWHSVRDFYNVTGDCHYYVDGVLKTIFSPDENNAFCVENKGYYEMRWTITPIDEELQNIAERTIFLKVNVG